MPGKDKFYVLDDAGNPVYDDDVDDADIDAGPQSFTTFDDAEKRAYEFARYAPGTQVKIVAVIATVTAEVHDPVTYYHDKVRK